MKKRGFTITELLVVISIIGILSAVVFVGLKSSRERSKVAKAKADISNIGLAVTMLYADTRKYPLGLDKLSPTVDYQHARYITTTETFPDYQVELVDNKLGYANWSGPYYKGSTVDPWGTGYTFSYFYADPQNDGQYLTAITSKGPDKKTMPSDDPAKASDRCDDLYKSLSSAPYTSFSGPLAVSISACTPFNASNLVE